ncbi:MAG: hypothetical protein WDM81_14740 [Rhizomicrobium sp.]
MAAKAHAAALSDQIIAADPLVAARLQGGAVRIFHRARRSGAARRGRCGLLGRSLANEANVLAFNDVFRLVAWLSLATALYLGYLIILYADTGAGSRWWQRHERGATDTSGSGGRRTAAARTGAGVASARPQPAHHRGDRRARADRDPRPSLGLGPAALRRAASK